MKYSVIFRIMKGGKQYARAVIEIEAKNAYAAEYRALNLFSESTIADGDGIALEKVTPIEE